MLCVLSFLLVLGGTETVEAASGYYTNAYYAIDSYNELGYTAHADQVALGWGEIRSKNGNVYFTQEKREGNPVRVSEYGVPTGDVTGLVRRMKAQNNKLMLSVYLLNSPSTGNMLRTILDSEDMQSRIIGDMVNALRTIKAYDYEAAPNASGEYPGKDVTDARGKSIGYDGLIIDFEQLFDHYADRPGISYRDKFAAFLQKLKDAMPAGKTLSVTIPPKRQPGIAYSDGYDYKRIGATADEVILMAHDYQWKDGSIKATAPYDLVKEALDFAVKEIPAEKILLQVSMGPVQWQNGVIYRPSYESMMNALDGKNAGEKVIEVTPGEDRFDPELKVGYAYLKREIYKEGILQGTVEDEIYYENSLSIAYKQQLAREYGLKGMSLWRLGMNAKDATEQFFRMGETVPGAGSGSKMPDETLYEEIRPSGESTVSGEKEWRITFNAAIDPRTIDEGIEVWKKEGGTWSECDITPVLDSKNDKSVLVKMDDGYPKGEYRLFMKETLAGINGCELGKGRVMKFTVTN